MLRLGSKKDIGKLSEPVVFPRPDWLHTLSIHRVFPEHSIIPMESLKVGRHLGQGEFGTVEQCRWMREDGSEVVVAMKTLKKHVLERERDLKSYLTEAAVLQRASHE